MRCWRVIGAVFAALLACAATNPGRAAEDDASGGFLTAFPDNDVYQLSVFGDTFADGLLAGLADAFGSDTRLNIQRKLQEFSGVMSAEFEIKAVELDQAIAAQPLNIAVVMLGEDDRVPLKSSSGRKVAIASDEWMAEYTRRIDRIMKAFKRKNAGVYWVGLPNLARSDANEQAQKMNDVIRERAYLNGYKYIDAFAGFSDENGAYSAYGPDLEGKIRVLRQGDGINFTDAGNRKLAHFVEKELRRDLNQAKSNRTVPLLGAEPEQAKINPDNAVKTPAPSSPAASVVGGDVPVVKAAKIDGTSASNATDASGDQKVDNGRISFKGVGPGGREENQTVEILRPSIPASVVALMARREGSSQSGDLLVDQIAGGLTLMSSITPAGNSARGKLAPTQAPYFRLLVKGERLQPKPGRADDTAWPPPSAKAGAASDAGRSTEPRG